MRKALFLLLVSLVFSFTACNDGNNKELINSQFDNSTYSATESRPESSNISSYEDTTTAADSYAIIDSKKGRIFQTTYEIADEIYHNDNINTTITYPQISGHDLEEQINSLLMNAALEMTAGESSEQDGLSIDIEYVIGFANEKKLSIIYKGLRVSSAPYPTNMIFSVNIDLGKGTIIELADVYPIDQQFETIVGDEDRNLSEQQLIGLQNIKENTLSNGNNLSAAISRIGTTFDGNHWYFDQDSIGIIFKETVHAIGDYVIIEIPYEELNEIYSRR